MLHGLFGTHDLAWMCCNAHFDMYVSHMHCTICGDVTAPLLNCCYFMRMSSCLDLSGSYQEGVEGGLPARGLTPEVLLQLLSPRID